MTLAWRSIDIEDLEKALAIVKNGDVVGMHMSGTSSGGGAQGGAAGSSYETAARPALSIVPSSTLLYGEKGYYTGTRARASRYGIR